MMKQIHIYITILCGVLLASCANLGQGPQGGPRDSIPPMVVKESPLNGTLQFAAKRIEVQFDEYVQLADIQKNVLISPPQQNPPEVKAVGKSVTVTFNEPLQDSTTYTIDFGAAICDYNEKTPLEGYVYSFSTGDVIDSLAISGRLYDAATLDPLAGVMVGIHRNLEDSALTTLPFTRITRTNSEGEFTIRNVHSGTYRLYALNDISRDYLYQPGEAVAFLDSLVTPYCQVEIHHDTIWSDTLGVDPVTHDTLFSQQVDSVYSHPVTHFYPDSLILWYFEEARVRHYFQRMNREEPHAFTLVFSAPQDSLPILRALRPSEVDSLGNDSAWVNFMDYALLQASKNLDTLTYWLMDSLAIRMDSIHIEMQYMASDSLYNLVSRTDTILAVYRQPRMSEKARESYEKRKRERKLELKTNASSSFEIYDTIRITSSYPLDSIHVDRFHLLQNVDTTRKSVACEVIKKDSMGMELLMLATLQPEQTYTLMVDSAACCDIYGACNESLEQTIRLKALDDYSSLIVKLVHFDSLARIQLMDDKDRVVRELPASPEGTTFQYLAPITFYLRLYIDCNGDGEWTTGDWSTKRQPEPIYYYPNKLKLRANWDFEESFDHLATPQTEAKPKALIGKNSKKN